MRYVEVSLDREINDEAYRIYVTHSLQLNPQGKYITKRYDELIKQSNEPEKSGDEIAIDIITRAGLKLS